MPPGSHVQRVLTGSGGKVEEDTVTLNHEKGAITCVDEGRDLEHIPSTLKNPRHYEIYRRNIRDKFRVEIGVRCRRHDVSNGEAHDGN